MIKYFKPDLKENERPEEREQEGREHDRRKPKQPTQNSAPIPLLATSYRRNCDTEEIKDGLYLTRFITDALQDPHEEFVVEKDREAEIFFRASMALFTPAYKYWPYQQAPPQNLGPLFRINFIMRRRSFSMRL